MKYKYSCPDPACHGKGFDRKNEYTRHVHDTHGTETKIGKDRVEQRTCGCGEAVGGHGFKCPSCKARTRKAYNDKRRENRPPHPCRCGAMLPKNRKKCDACKLASKMVQKPKRARPERRCKCGAILETRKQICDSCKERSRAASKSARLVHHCKCAAALGFRARKCDACKSKKSR